MKHSIKISVMALVAMFAFSTVADAQTTTISLGGLNKLRKGLGLKTKKEKAIDAITPTIPQPEEGAKPIVMKWMKKRVGEWNPETLELIFDQTYDEGEYAGKHVQFKLDPKTGKWTNIAGNVAGQMSNDGTLQTPNLGTINLDPKTLEVSKDGEVIGQVSVSDATCYDYKMGEFSGGYVSPLLMAYAFHGTMLSESQIVTFKQLKQKRDEEAAAKAAAERAAALKGWDDVDCVFSGRGFAKWDGEAVRVENANHAVVGYVKTSGIVEDAYHKELGYIGTTMSNYVAKKNTSLNPVTIGYFSGQAFEKEIGGGAIASISPYSQSITDANNSTIGRISGKYNNKVVTACFYFFFYREYTR